MSFLSGDYDGDRVDDLFAIGYARSSRRVQIHVHSGATGFRSRLLAARTGLKATSARPFAFGLGDRDHDGSLDLYAISYDGARVQVLDGAERYRSVRSATRTPLRRTSASTFQFAIGDRDNDGSDDIYAIRHRRAGATTAYVLDGATSFGSVQATIRTALPKTTTGRVRFVVGDENDDGHEDIYAIRYRRGAKTAEILSLAGPRFDSVDLRARVTLPPARKGGWAFALPAQPGL